MMKVLAMLACVVACASAVDVRASSMNTNAKSGFPACPATITYAEIVRMPARPPPLTPTVPRVARPPRSVARMSFAEGRRGLPGAAHFLGMPWRHGFASCQRSGARRRTAAIAPATWLIHLYPAGPRSLKIVRSSAMPAAVGLQGRGAG